MRGDILQIGFELGGFPKALSSESQWRKAIRDGELTRTTIVVVYRQSKKPISQIAEKVPELRVLFDEAEAAPAVASADSIDIGKRVSPARAGGEPEDETRGPRIDWWPMRKPKRVEPVESDPETPENSRRKAVALMVVCALLLPAGLAGWVALDRHPSQAGVDWRPKMYRVKATANLRRAASLKGKLVRTLRRNEFVKAIADAESKGAWVEIVEGNDAGFFVWAENLELVNLSSEEVARME